MLEYPMSRRRVLQLGLLATGTAAAISPDVHGAWRDRGLTPHTIGKREFLLQIPTDAAERGPLPVLMLFHGGGSKAAGFARYSGFQGLCNQGGFIGVYPQGVNKHWYDARYRRAVPPPRGVDDLASVHRLIDWVLRHQQADARRIYAMGMSNGGIFVQELGLLMADRLAAIASACAQLPSPLVTDFSPNAPLSVLMMNGTDDPIVPYQGGEVGMRRRWGRDKGKRKATGRVMATGRNVRLWVEHNGLAPKPTIIDLPNSAPGDGCRVQRLRWSHRQSGSASGMEPVVELVRIEGGGHTLPGRSRYLPEKIVGRVCRDIDSTPTIWRFLSAQRRS